MWGVLNFIPDDNLAALDQGEGAGYSRRREVLRGENGTASGAWVYVATEPDGDPTLRPDAWYKRFLVKGAKEHGLPPTYIDRLETIEAIDDPDAERDRKKRALQCDGAG